MTKRTTAVAAPTAVALQAAWLGPLGRYVGAGELVDVSRMAAGDVDALMAAGVLAAGGHGQETGPSAARPGGHGQETGPSGVVELSGHGQETGSSGQVEAQPEAATIMQDEE